MKNILVLFSLFVLTVSSNLSAQPEKIDRDIAETLKEVSCTCDFISCMNNYLSIEYMEEINEKEFKEYTKICKHINNHNIPINKITTSARGIDFFFKKGKNVYAFSLEKKNDIYYSTVKLYTFKNRRIKKQGRMAFKA